MPSSQKALRLSDSRRDAEKYHRLLLATEHAVDEIGLMEKDRHINIDDLLSRLLPNLVEALDATQAFVAVYKGTQAKDKKKWFELTCAYPNEKLSSTTLGYPKLLASLALDGKPCIVEPLEDDSENLIPGLEIFNATAAILVRMQIADQTRIVGICNKIGSSHGRFLATDRRTLDILLKLIGIGTRIGERRRRELENIQNITSAISSELNLSELLTIISRGASEVFDTQTVSLMLLDEKKEHYYIAKGRGLSEHFIHKQRISAKKLHKAISSEGLGPIVIKDLKRTPFGLADLIKKEGLYSVLNAPLLSSNSLIGFLNIYSKDVLRDFSEDEIELAEIFANHAAIAIQNAQRRQRELEGLLATSEALKATLDEGDFLEMIVRRVSKFFSVPAVSLLFWDKTQANLIIRCSRGLSKKYANNQLLSKEAIFQKTDILRKRLKPFVISTSNFISNRYKDILATEGFHNALVAPLIVPGEQETIGFLVLYNKNATRQFSTDEIKMVNVIADQVVVAIQTTQLHYQMKRRGEQLNALNQIAINITSKLALEELLQAIIKNATMLLEGQGGIVYRLDPKGNIVIPVASYGHNKLATVKVDQHRGIISRIIKSKQPITVSNYYRWSERQKSLDEYKLTAVLGAPILTGKNFVGIIAVHDSRQEKLFGETEKELLQRFADLAAVAIENAEAYAAERQTKEYLHSLISSALDGIIAIDSEGSITNYNASAERICGYTREEVRNLKVWELYGDLETAREINKELLKQNKLENYETKVLAKDGREIPIMLSASLLKDEDGNHTGSVGFFKDMRPLRKTFDAINAIASAHDLPEGLHALATGLIKNLDITFCYIMMLNEKDRKLKIEEAYPATRVRKLDWKPNLEGIIGLNDFPLMKRLLKSPHTHVYRNGESVDNIDILETVRKNVNLKAKLESVAIIPILGEHGVLGACILGEMRSWERSRFTEEKLSAGDLLARNAAAFIDRLQLRLQEGLLNASKEITSLRELPEILQSIADSVRTALNCDLVTLYTYHEAKDILSFPPVTSGKLYNQSDIQALGRTSKKSVIWKILEKGEAHFAHNARQDHFMLSNEVERPQGVIPFVIREKISSSAALPLLIGNERVGAFFVNYRHSHHFIEQEKRNIEIFAKQAAIAIHNARLFELSETKGKYLRALLEAGKALLANSFSDRSSLLQRILKEAVESMTGINGEKATVGTIQIMDQRTNELVFECAHPKSVMPKIVGKLGQRLSLNSESGITVRAACTGKTQLVRNVKNNVYYLPFSKKTRSELAVPLLDGDQVLGVLDVESDIENGFDEDDIRALEALADLAILVLKSAEQTQRLNRTNSVAMMAAWGAEIAHDVNREAGAIQRKLYLLQQDSLTVPSEIKKTLEEIERYAISLVLPPLPKRQPELGEVIETDDAPILDHTIFSYIDFLKLTYPNIKFVWDLNCGELAVSIHEQWLRRLLRHLIRNAIHAIPEEGKNKRVTIRTSIQGAFARIEIEDTGKGVRQEIIPMLFQQAIHHSDDNRDGQGLLIVRFLAERHGGATGLAWNQSGRGACFYFTVPILP